MQREIHHNTEDQCEQYVRRALDILERVDPPEDLRPAVFSVLAGFVASKQIFFDQPLPGGILRPGRG